MEHEPLQPVSSSQPVPVHKKYKGAIIALAVALVAILMFVLVHKKSRTPEEDLQALNAVSEPTSLTVEQRAGQLSKLRSVSPAEQTAKPAAATIKTNQ